MTPSTKAKQAGLSSLAELSELSDVKVRTLDNWFHKNPKRFECILAGAVAIKYIRRNT